MMNSLLRDFYSGSTSAVKSESSHCNMEIDQRESKVLEEIKNVREGNSSVQFATLQARSIRVGSYKSLTKGSVILIEKAIQMSLPSTSDSQVLVTLTILKSDIVKIQAHFGRSMPALFVYVSPNCCDKIRKLLGMVNKSEGLWLDLAASEESMKRITILPEKMNEDAKGLLFALYGSLIEEIEDQVVNNILVRSSPSDTTLQVNEKYCQFPPSGSNTISVMTEDYDCLGNECFLNDVIIDFFFKWLQYSCLSPVDRDRTHIFSTFFYKRLTMRPPPLKNKRPHPIEDNPKLSAAQKRYARVKRWTKSVNIFDKDFVIVPINEHSHWFVAVICFPGMEGCRTLDKDEPCPVPARQQRVINATKRSKQKKERKKVIEDQLDAKIGLASDLPKVAGDYTSILNKMDLNDDLSDRDEASGSDEDMVDEEESILSSLKQAAALLKENSSENQLLSGNQVTKNDPLFQNATVSLNGDEDIEMKCKTFKLSDFKPENHSEPEVSETTQSEKNVLNHEGTNGNLEEQTDESEPKVKLEMSEDPESEGGTRLNLEEEQVPIKQPCILVFDSLPSGSRPKVVATLRDYLDCEYREKIGKDRVFNKETMRGCCPKVPQQPNFYDCGIYVLQFIESFFKNPLTDFCLPVTGLRNWFGYPEVRNKRAKIADTIRDLASKQFPEKKFQFPDISFSSVSGYGYTDSESGSSDEDEELFVSSETLITFGQEKVVDSECFMEARLADCDGLLDAKLPNGTRVTTSNSVDEASFVTSSLPPVNVESSQGKVEFVTKLEDDISIQNVPDNIRVENVFVPRILKKVPSHKLNISCDSDSSSGSSSLSVISSSSSMTSLPSSKNDPVFNNFSLILRDKKLDSLAKNEDKKLTNNAERKSISPLSNAYTDKMPTFNNVDTKKSSSNVVDTKKLSTNYVDTKTSYSNSVDTKESSSSKDVDTKKSSSKSFDAKKFSTDFFAQRSSSSDNSVGNSKQSTNHIRSSSSNSDTKTRSLPKTDTKPKSSAKSSNDSERSRTSNFSDRKYHVDNISRWTANNIDKDRKSSSRQSYSYNQNKTHSNGDRKNSSFYYDKRERYSTKHLDRSMPHFSEKKINYDDRKRKSSLNSVETETSSKSAWKRSKTESSSQEKRGTSRERSDYQTSKQGSSSSRRAKFESYRS